VDARDKSWAVTGPSGAGKSRFCAMLAEMGALVIDADREGHRVLELPDVKRQLTAAFGRDILRPDGTVDRGILGPRVFASAAARQRLDTIAHPPLAAALVTRLAAARGEAPLVILEAAVYFLLPGPPPVDRTVAVTAAPEIRLERLVAGGLDRERARARIAGQAHLEATWDRADTVVRNDGDQARLRAVAATLWREHVAPPSRGGEP